jgi:hypothetical protein
MYVDSQNTPQHVRHQLWASSAIKLLLLFAIAAAAACAEGPSAAAPPEAFPWNATACAASAVGQQCLTNCRWPSYDGPGYWVTCLGDGTWSGPGGSCFPGE